MILDSSAIVAILRDEPERPAFSSAIDTAATTLISAATVLESSIVIGRTRHEDLDDLLSDGDVVVVPFDVDHARLAREAYVRFGKRSGSPAQLNFGDCMAYALAKATGEPLLFKGDDFTHTDVTPAR